jgi:hypothetical protein
VAADPNAEWADYAGHLATYPGGEMSLEMRPDGIHLGDDAHIVGAWIGDELLRIHEQWITERWITEATADLAPEE